MAGDQFFTAPVERIAAGGDGIVRYRGRSFFMSFTAPGDRVVGRLTGEGDRAELVGLEEASPHRTAPVCPLYGSCGGCSLQHLSYESQLAEKARILKESLRRTGKLESLPELRIVPSPPYEYRNRFEFHRVPPGNSNFESRRRRLQNPPRRNINPNSESSGAKRRRGQTVGLKGRKSGVIVPVPDCPVADPAVRRALGEGLVPPPEKDRFTVYGRGDLLLYEGGTRRGTVSILGKGIRMDGAVFFQSNALMLEALAGDLSELAGGMEDLPAADLYAGVGTFSSFLGDHFSQLDLLEENKRALTLARENMENLAKSRPSRNGSFRYFPMTDDRWVKTMGGKKAAYGFAVADPPRQGFSPTMAQWLAREGPPALAYISCNPAALARDSRELAAGGYRLDSLTFYDFYPQTAHIESLGIFKKG
jgi:23S rRNA (uracil1939-C5)-methyltransferase